MFCQGEKMNFDEYQEQSGKTAIYPDRGKNFTYPTLGLSGETGEVAEKIKKVIRDKGGVVDDATRDALRKELGDVLWYVAQLCTELDLSMSDVAENNIEKLLSRQKRGQLSGEGDSR